MRFSISRMLVRYSSSFCWSFAPKEVLTAETSCSTKSRIDRCWDWRRIRLCLRSPCEPAPKRRSKSNLGFASGATGVVGDRQARLYWYAQEYPESHDPDLRIASQ